MPPIPGIPRQEGVGRRGGFRRSRGGRLRRLWTLILVGVVAAEVVVGLGRASNWYGFGPYVPPNTGTVSPPPSGPNLNPYNETISAVLASITYTGSSSGYFAALQGTQICPRCPVIARTESVFSPPFVGFPFYVNVTNGAGQWETLSNFTLSTGGANPTLFVLALVVCCYPLYQYLVLADGVGFVPDQTLGLGGFAEAGELPDVGPAGFTLYFNVTSP